MGIKGWRDEGGVNGQCRERDGVDGEDVKGSRGEGNRKETGK